MIAAMLVMVGYMAVVGKADYPRHKQELVSELYMGQEPFQFCNSSMVDKGYPHTNLAPWVCELVMKNAPQPLVLWAEAGSMLGGSLIRTANVWKRVDPLGLNPLTIVAIDPFTGDVNMWAWEKNIVESNKWSFLGMKNGQPTIYERFCANVIKAEVDNLVIPIRATSLVGMKLLRRLHTEKRLSGRPQVIYLDSAHELEETLVELKVAWDLLSPGGILFGDDWGWSAVQHDVKAFAVMYAETIDEHKMNGIAAAEKHIKIVEKHIVLAEDSQWILIKKV